MLRSRISWTCVIGVIVSMPVDGIILYNAVKYWAPVTFGFGLHKEFTFPKWRTQAAACERVNAGFWHTVIGAN